MHPTDIARNATPLRPTDLVDSASARPPCSSCPQGGYVFGLVLNVVLLLLIAGELVFLASHYRVRIDLTGDKVYTLTESTSRVLDRLEDRLLIEAYFSPDDELPATLSEPRQTLRNMLDEFVQTSKGKVVVQYFDPQSDADLREKATRLGVKPQRTQDVQQTTLSNKEIWQGLRLMYGGKKQKTVDFIRFSPLAAMYEAALTPIIKALTVAEKPKIGVIAQPSLPPVLRGYIQESQREGPKQFKQILGWDVVTERYEIVPVDISNRQLIPENLSTLLLIRPKDLNDRQKYAIDQFLMRGGKLVVFADSWDVSLGQQRLLRVREVDYDHANSSLKFLDQLAHYGAKVGEKFLLDDSTAAQQPLQILVSTPQGLTYAQPLPYYPYCFKPLDLDWSTHAEEAAKNAEGEVDDALAAEYQKTFEPGIDKERTRGLGIPTFFWPCAVGLTDPLPDGVEGHVLMRTSPWAVEQAPPADVNPIGTGQNMQVAYNQFGTAIKQLVQSEPRHQLGLMVELTGTFPSYFDGRKIPPAREEEPPKVVKDEGDPLAEPITTDPAKEGDAKDEEPEVLGPPQQTGSETPAESAGDDEPEPILRAREGARLVVLGDAEFIRDDLITGEYQQIGGPVSTQAGPLFFINLLDWLAEDQDLFALRRKDSTDRSLHFLSDEEVRGATNLQKLEEQKRRKESMVRLANIAVPPAFLLLFGVIVFIQRRAKKRAFLARLGS